MKHLIPPEHADDALRIELVADRTTLAPTALRVLDDASEVEVLMALSAAIVHRCSSASALRRQLAEVIAHTADGDLKVDDVEVWLEDRCVAERDVLLKSGAKVASAIKTLGLGKDTCLT